MRTRDENVDEDEAVAETSLHKRENSGHQTGLLVDEDATAGVELKTITSRAALTY